MNNILKFNCKSGLEYENTIVNMLTKAGLTANRVGNNDGRVDIFASIKLKTGDFNFNIQCKLYNRPIGKEPIQQVFTGTHYYNNGATPVVITNNTISSEARLYAKNLGVEIIADMEWLEMEKAIQAGVVINRNCGSLMKILLAYIMKNDTILPVREKKKSELQTDKERLKLEIISKYDLAEELSRESARLSLEAANKAQESLRLQKEAMLINLESG